MSFITLWAIRVLFDLRFCKHWILLLFIDDACRDIFGLVLLTNLTECHPPASSHLDELRTLLKLNHVRAGRPALIGRKPFLVQLLHIFEA